ncbi:MAG: hypothetical protein A2V21_300305 [Deltaproteobacteria bacterium GWC2_55_46]|nr:MAG: hypothetical protein A2Z79_10900 [Deltaproteobacteria bacterium GWA2_55_82]OIJ72831.1 MAG: hypothetical protein A2V21_300305 [Deltaproteobacteria bacterium GWC2_55_46]
MMKNKVITAVLAGAALGGALYLGWYGLTTPLVLASQESAVSSLPSAPGAQAEKGLLAAINRKEKEIEAREGDLLKKEERLNAIKGDIESRLGELRKVQQDIESMVKKINEVNDERIRKIVKIYESMGPEEAASRIEALDKEMAVMILATMSERKASKILAFVNVAKSVELSRSFKVK